MSTEFILNYILPATFPFIISFWLFHIYKKDFPERFKEGKLIDEPYEFEAILFWPWII